MAVKYTLSIGDKTIRGESFAKHTPAWDRAKEIASSRGVNVIILCDGIATSAVDPLGGAVGAVYQLKVSGKMLKTQYSASTVREAADRHSKAGKAVMICDGYGKPTGLAIEPIKARLAASTGSTKALSVKQPFAELIATGEKKIEYRSWQVAHRGPLLIVASKSPNVERCAEFGMDPAKLAHGVSICVVDLHKITGDDGDYEWHLRNPRRVDPVAIRGFAALYTVKDELIRVVTPKLLPA